MKKKVKDLTCKDLVDICKKTDDCLECPLGRDWCAFLPCNQEELLEKEIEVEEDE